MKSSVTKGLDWIWRIFPAFFIAYILIEMIHDGEWWWLTATLGLMALLLIFFTVGLGWWFGRSRTCPSKWMGKYPCRLPKNHIGQHVGGYDTVFRWVDVDVSD